MEFKLGEQYQVKVQKILTGGILVELEGGETEFIHKSKISNEFITDINEFVAVGDTYTARVIEGKNKPTELSLRDDNNIVKRQTTVTPAAESPKHTEHNKQPNRSERSLTLEEMISRSTAAMREKYQGRDKETGARYRKRRNKNGGKGD